MKHESYSTVYSTVYPTESSIPASYIPHRSHPIISDSELLALREDHKLGPQLKQWSRVRVK